MSNKELLFAASTIWVVVAAIVDSARSGNESGDGLVWTTAVGNPMHNRTGMPLEEVEVG